MDSYNLAICFGPTLMPIPDGQDPVACQAHVNEVIKTIIVHNEVIFPSQRELDGPVYEKCMTGGEEYWWVRWDQDRLWEGKKGNQMSAGSISIPSKDFVNKTNLSTHKVYTSLTFYCPLARQWQPPQWTGDHWWGWQWNWNTHQWWRSVRQMKLLSTPWTTFILLPSSGAQGWKCWSGCHLQYIHFSFKSHHTKYHLLHSSWAIFGIPLHLMLAATWPVDLSVCVC